ncbi:MAG: hypothetical protein R6U99_04905 [Nioella sp.]
MTLYLACIATVVCCTIGANAIYKHIEARRAAADDADYSDTAQA